MRNRTNIIFLLDKSGSMHMVRRETIDGFNGFIEEQKQDNPNARMTLVLFSNSIETKYVGKRITEVDKLNKATYSPHGLTALYDAIGIGVKEFDQYLEKEGSDSDDKNIVIVLTDGMENSSTMYDKNDITKLIAEKERRGWKFVYLGANVDAYEEASKAGFNPIYVAAVTYNDIKSGTVYTAMSQIISAVSDDDGDVDSHVKKIMSNITTY